MSQGSVHFLLLVYINNTAKHLLRLKMIAHCVILQISGIINHDLQLLTIWARQWLETFNPLKTVAVLFTLEKLDFLPHFVLYNTPIRVKSGKLGHQVNSDTRLQTVEIQMRRLLLSRLIRSFTVSLVNLFLFQ